jgi:hypothetical protein
LHYCNFSQQDFRFDIMCSLRSFSTSDVLNLHAKMDGATLMISGHRAAHHPATKLAHRVNCLAGTSLSRTTFYDIVGMTDDSLKPIKHHGNISSPPYFFHWIVANDDFNMLVEDGTDGRTGRLAYNVTISSLLNAMSLALQHPKSLFVISAQIFDIMKAPLADYSANMMLLRDALLPYVLYP